MPRSRAIAALVTVPIALLALSGCLPQPPAAPEETQPAVPQITPGATAPVETDPDATGDSSALDGPMTEIAETLAAEPAVVSATWEGDVDYADGELLVTVSRDIERDDLQPLAELLLSELETHDVLEALDTAIVQIQDDEDFSDSLVRLYPGAPEDLTPFFDAWEWGTSVRGDGWSTSVSIGGGGYSSLDVYLPGGSMAGVMNDLPEDMGSWFDVVSRIKLVSLTDDGLCTWFSMSREVTQDEIDLLVDVVRSSDVCAQLSIEEDYWLVLDVLPAGEYESDPELRDELVTRIEDELGVEVQTI